MKLILLLVWTGVIFFVATNIQAGWLYVIDSILLSIFFLSLIIPYLNLKNLSVDITVPELVMKGEPANLILTVINKSKFPKFLIMFNISLEPFSPYIEPEHQNPRNKEFFRKKHENEIKEGLVYVSKKDKTQINLQYTPKKRGVIKLNQVEMLSSIPFGFKTVRKKFKLNKTIYVYPKIFPMSKNFKSKLNKLTFENYPDNIPAGIRNYQPYDSLKMIHWSYSAKYQQIMSKKFDTEMIQKDLTFLINDTNQEKLEIIMDTLISLLNYLIFGEKDVMDLITLKNSKTINNYFSKTQIKIGGMNGPFETFYEWNLILKYLAQLKATNLNQVFNKQKYNNIKSCYFVTYKGDSNIYKESQNALIVTEDDLEKSS